MRKKEINLISLTDRSNGAENILLKMAINVKGKLFFIVKSRDRKLIIPEDLSKTYLSDRNIFFGMLKLIPLLRKLKRDEVVMSTHPYLNAYLGFFKRIGYLKSQLIVRECTSVFTRFTGMKKLAYQIIYEVGYPAADLVICQTDIMKTQLLDHNSFLNPNRVIVQPNPVDVEKMILLANEPSVDDDLSSEYICAAGRLIPEKGFNILIDSFKIIHESNPNLKLYILGEGRERQTLLELIESNKLQDSVILKGHISNPAPYFKNAKLCVVSSIKEGFPNVLLEMMALNSAVISTLCAGGISTIPNIKTVEVNNVEALAIAMKNTLENSQLISNPHVDFLLERSPKNFAESTLRALAQL